MFVRILNVPQICATVDNKSWIILKLFTLLDDNIDSVTLFVVRNLCEIHFLDTRTYDYQGVRNASFAGNFAYVINKGLPSAIFCKIFWKMFRKLYNNKKPSYPFLHIFWVLVPKIYFCMVYWLCLDVVLRFCWYLNIS